MGNYSKAADDLQKSIDLNAQYWPSHNTIGICMVQLNRLDIAERAFKNASSLAPQNPAPYSNLARLMSMKKQFDSAIEYANMAIQCNSKSAVNFALRASIHADRKDFQAAEQDMSMAISLNGEIAQYYAVRGQYRKTLGLTSKANEDLAKAKQLGYKQTSSDRQVVANPETGKRISYKSFAGTWVYKGKSKGYSYDCLVTFGGGTFTYRFKYTDPNGKTFNFRDNGTFVIKNRTTLELDKTAHAFQFKDGYFWLTFPQVGLKFPMKRSSN